MTDHPHNRVREAVYEIVNTAPIAPAIDDLEARRVERRKRSPVLISAIVVMIVAALVALTSRHSESTEGNGTSVESITSAPLNHELSTTDAFRIVRQSQAALANMDTMAGPLIQRCMAAKGFAFTPNSTELMSEQDERAFLLQRYPEPRQQDGVWGYLFESTDQTESGPESTERESPDAALPGYANALQGQTIATGSVKDLVGQVATTSTVGDGCVGQAMATIFGNAQAYIDFFTQLQTLEMITGASYFSLRTSPDFLARNQPWSQCMKRAGFDYPTIFGPRDRDWPSPRPTETEQQVAEADSTCRQGKGLDGADLNVLEGGVLTDVLKEHPLGDYTAFDRQVQDLLAGSLPSAGVDLSSTVTVADEPSIAPTTHDPTMTTIAASCVGTHYTVVNGDYLALIATKNRTTVEALLAANGWSDLQQAFIYPGLEIALPATDDPSITPAAGCT